MGRLKKIKGRQSFGRRFWKAFKRIDLYGKDISLSYEGEEKFKTYIGAITSFIIGTTMVVYFVYRDNIIKKYSITYLVIES